MKTVTLPYPVSANRYWRTAVVCGRAQTYVSKEGKAYKQEVAWLAKAAGIRKPFPGRVRIDIFLYPAQPNDWLKRARENPATWDDDVRCIDIDNARKVLYDALEGIAIVNDKFVWEDGGKRMEPDGKARMIVQISEVFRETIQDSLL